MKTGYCLLCGRLGKTIGGVCARCRKDEAERRRRMAGRTLDGSKR